MGTAVVVGVDGSPASIAALQHGHRLAAAMDVEVHAVACWLAPQMAQGHAVMGISHFEEKARLTLNDAVVAAFGNPPPPNLRTRLVNGDARQVLLSAGKDAGMLVVGRRGHGGFGGLLLGSVSSACVAHAECPVLVVHAARAAL